MIIAPRSALFLPASNPRAIAKARTLDADMVILDLEDAVSEDSKAEARGAAIEALAEPFGNATVAIRLNAADTDWHIDDVAALSRSKADLVVIPKVEDAATAAKIADAVGRPVYAMIETPAGVLAATAIAAADGVAGLIAGTNDLAHTLRLPTGGRAGLALSLQTIVLAVRDAGIVALDGVWNRLDDPDGLAAECAEGRALGFDGKTLIHPDQIAAANAGFAPSDAEIEDARALVEAATSGAARFRGRMVEAMHVESARQILARASGKATDPRL
jgi:citrate lyase subunit beta/citryl-CoA lyase